MRWPWILVLTLHLLYCMYILHPLEHSLCVLSLLFIGAAYVAGVYRTAYSSKERVVLKAAIDCALDDKNYFCTQTGEFKNCAEERDMLVRLRDKI